MIRRPPRSTHCISSAASDVYKRQDISFKWDSNNDDSYRLNITAVVSTTGKTGVEMEALTAASVTALTIYDMTKAIDKGMIIGETYLESKSGGKSGDFHRKN